LLFETTLTLNISLYSSSLELLLDYRPSANL